MALLILLKDGSLLVGETMGGKRFFKCTFGTMYSEIDQVKFLEVSLILKGMVCLNFFKGCLPLILFSPF